MKEVTIRKFTIVGTIQVEQEEVITNFLERIGWKDADGSVADAIRSEITANLDDVLNPIVTLVVEESDALIIEHECFDKFCGNEGGHIHRRIELS